MFDDDRGPCFRALKNYFHFIIKVIIDDCWSSYWQTMPILLTLFRTFILRIKTKKRKLTTKHSDAIRSHWIWSQYPLIQPTKIQFMIHKEKDTEKGNIKWDLIQVDEPSVRWCRQPYINEWAMKWTTTTTILWLAGKRRMKFLILILYSQFTYIFSNRMHRWSHATQS